MIEIFYPTTNALRICLAEPIELFRIGRALCAIAVDEIDEAAADAFDRRDVERFCAACAGIRFGATRHGMSERMRRVDDPPRHGGRAWPVKIDKSAAETLSVGVQDIIDVALTVEIYRPQ